jgi:hypothetical protein
VIDKDFNDQEHPDDDRVVDVLLQPGADGLWRIRLARWQAHQGVWIYEWTGRPVMEHVIGWRERIQCACQRA